MDEGIAHFSFSLINSETRQLVDQGFFSWLFPWKVHSHGHVDVAKQYLSMRLRSSKTSKPLLVLNYFDQDSKVNVNQTLEDHCSPKVWIRCVSC